jgi:hypothetical protein
MPQPPGIVLLTFIPRASLVAKTPPSLTRRCFGRTNLRFCPISCRPFRVQGRPCSTHAAVVATPTPPLLRPGNLVIATKSKPQESDIIATCQKEDTLRSLFNTCKRYAGTFATDICTEILFNKLVAKTSYCRNGKILLRPQWQSGVQSLFQGAPRFRYEIPGQSGLGLRAVRSGASSLRRSFLIDKQIVALHECYSFHARKRFAIHNVVGLWCGPIVAQVVVDAVDLCSEIRQTGDASDHAAGCQDELLLGWKHRQPGIAGFGHMFRWRVLVRNICLAMVHGIAFYSTRKKRVTALVSGPRYVVDVNVQSF